MVLNLIYLLCSATFLLDKRAHCVKMLLPLIRGFGLDKVYEPSTGFRRQYGFPRKEEKLSMNGLRPTRKVVRASRIPWMRALRTLKSSLPTLIKADSLISLLFKPSHFVQLAV